MCASLCFKICNKKAFCSHKQLVQWEQKWSAIADIFPFSQHYKPTDSHQVCVCGVKLCFVEQMTYEMCSYGSIYPC